MLDPKKLNEFISEVIDALPPGVKSLPQDVQKNIKAGLHTALNKMDLVTREEFDAQKTVLERTRAKLETLEAKIKELEKE